MEDRELVEAYQRGDRAAFETLYHRYKDWVLSVAYRFCGNREEALDILQEVFTYFFRKLPEFEVRSALKTFLYPVIKHTALSRKRRPQAPLQDRPVDAPTGDRAEDLLAGLPEEQKEIVWLRFVDGYDLQGIADLLQIPLGTVKSRLHAALQALRRKS